MGKALKLSCLKFIQSSDPPTIGTIAADLSRRTQKQACILDLKGGHLCSLMLKEEKKQEVPTPPRAVRDEADFKICSCDACRSSYGGDISDDEHYIPGARMGRRKGRKGVKPSRIMHWAHMDSCENESRQNESKPDSLN